jgi:uncharacterized membrane protein
MAKIYYVGDWAMMLGPIFAESPFNYEFKGTELFNYGKWLVDAIESDAQHSIVSVPAWEFYKLSPEAYPEILAEYDLFIFSDVEARNFQLHPSFFDRSKFGREPLTFPDRIRLTVEAIQGGKSALFLGGWLSFNGQCGKGGWGRTRLADVLPVECLPYEDLCENTEGFQLQATQAAHPLLAGIDLATAPPILGYNVTKPRSRSELLNPQVLANWSGTSDPALVVAECGRGRVAAYTSDPAPHWGCNLVYWNQYQRFWLNIVNWLVS